jgi:hypothetical protein
MLFLIQWVMWPLIIDQRLVHLTPHMFSCHISHSWIFCGVHFLVKKYIGVSLWCYWKWVFFLILTKMGVVWLLIIDQRLVHLTPHMFPCHRSHSWISGGYRFLVKKSVGVSLWYYWKWSSMLFLRKTGVVWPLINDQRLIHLSPHMFPCHKSHSWISGGDYF